MSNASVISTTIAGKAQELNQGGTGTGIIIFSTDGTAPMINHLLTAGQLASGSGVTGASSWIKVKAWGRVTGGGTTNYTATLQYGTSVTGSDNTTIEASTARAVNSENGLWYIEATIGVDAVADKIQGFGSSIVNNVALDAQTVIDNEITSVDVTDNADLGFVIGGTFSSGFAGNTSHLDGFQIVL